MKTNRIGQTPQDAPPRTVLVVDDSRAQRLILRSHLTRWGYEVIEAASGAEALTICKAQVVDLILSDWMMPGMDGIAFCQAFRALPERPFGYFILLTSKSEKPDIAKGLSVGADDFLSKPVSPDELRARLHAGHRIVEMERQLREKNRLVSATLDEMSTLYAELDNDLIEAQRLQQSLVREKSRDFGVAQVSLLLQPAGRVGGDLVGFFPVNTHEVGVFAIDVSGHGVASAMLTARLAGLLNSPSVAQNLTLTTGPNGTTRMLPLDVAAKRINAFYYDEIEAEQYFTMVLGKLDLNNRKLALVQCGHPSPLVQNPHGEVSVVGQGGLPIGLIEEANWEEFTIDLSAGGRVLIGSDGLTECPGHDGHQLEEDGLAILMRQNQSKSGRPLLEKLVREVEENAAGAPLPDDISAVLVEVSV